jgi:hypothetical protein
LIRNDLGGGFLATTQHLGVIYGVAAGDYDNDGDVDLFLSGGNRLLQNDGTLSFSDVTVSAGLSHPTASFRSSVWGDYDADGDIDLYMPATDIPNRLYRNNGDGTFSLVTDALLQDLEECYAASWADYDNDGDLDLSWGRKVSGLGCVLANNSGGMFTNATPGFFAGYSVTTMDWGDYDNDQDLDLYIGSREGAYSRLVRNDGGGAFADVTGTSGALLGLTGSSGVAWGDFDNDQDLDLFHVRGAGGAGWSLYRNDGGTFALQQSFPNGGVGVYIESSYTCALGDYDQDGDLDVMATRGMCYTGPGHLHACRLRNFLYRNDQSTGNHWLHVDLDASVSNRSAIGARVTVQAGGLTQIREVQGGSGAFATPSFTAEFGLGANTVADQVTVRWPSGIVTTLMNVAADQRIRLPEVSGDLTDVEGDMRRGPRLLEASPNPFFGRTRIEYELPAAGTVQLAVHDLHGRRVAILEDGLREAGRHAATWQGRGPLGEKVPSGVYFVRLVVPNGGTQTRKLFLAQ